LLWAAVGEPPLAEQRIRHRVGVNYVFTCADPLPQFVESHVQPLEVVASSRRQFSAASMTPTNL
jgi:hypothetical protein